MRAIAICFLLAVSLRGVAGAAGDELPARLLETMVVQDFGFEKTFLSFAEERIAALGRGAKVPDQHPILSVLGMVWEPDVWQERKLFKIDHPDLLAVFDHKSPISAADFFEPGHIRQMQEMIRSEATVKPAINDLNRRVSALLDVESQLAIVPRAEGEWVSPHALAEEDTTTGSADRAILEAFEELRVAYVHGDSDAFAAAAVELVEQNRSAAEASGTGLGRLKVDLLNTRLRPFKWSAVFYLLATLAYIAALGSKGRWIATVALALLLAGNLAHATGLGLRWVLVGRAPVSNMYESLVFATGGMVVIAVVLDWMYKNRLAGLAGALLGFIFIVIAIKMPLHQSRINPLIPALQSSWLTYHVITIMLSYSAFALSFFVSIIYLLKQALGGDEKAPPLLNAVPRLDALDFFNYRIIAVGFPLLTVGIFTGAVWAATAWGRPWAFDPKETWSAITWLVYGVYLHTRLLSGWKGTRSAVLGVIGFAAVLFTYLGVNYLLPGLHSYV